MLQAVDNRETRAPSAQIEEVRALFKAHGAFVWRCAARLGVAEHGRDDIVQDVFLVVYHRLPQFEGRSSITSWLFGIVRGLVSNRRRKAARRLHLQALQPEPEIVAPDPESAHAFERFVHELSSEQREVFVLAEVEGMSGPEIATALSLNLNTVYSRLRKARARFKRFATLEVTGKGSAR